MCILQAGNHGLADGTNVSRYNREHIFLLNFYDKKVL